MIFAENAFLFARFLLYYCVLQQCSTHMGQ